MKHLWFGKMINTDQELNDLLELLPAQISKTLLKQFSSSYFINICDHFSKALIDKEKCFKNLKIELLKEFSEQESEEMIIEIANFMNKDNLNLKLKRELGTDDVQDLKRIEFNRNIFETWCPLGVLTHIAPGNSPGLAFLAIIEGLLAGNINILKFLQ